MNTRFKKKLVKGTTRSVLPFQIRGRDKSVCEALVVPFHPRRRVRRHAAPPSVDVQLFLSAVFKDGPAVGCVFEQFVDVSCT